MPEGPRPGCRNLKQPRTGSVYDSPACAIGAGTSNPPESTFLENGKKNLQDVIFEYNEKASISERKSPINIYSMKEASTNHAT